MCFREARRGLATFWANFNQRTFVGLDVILGRSGDVVEQFVNDMIVSFELSRPLRDHQVLSDNDQSDDDTDTDNDTVDIDEIDLDDIEEVDDDGPLERADNDVPIQQHNVAVNNAENNVLIDVNAEPQGAIPPNVVLPLCQFPTSDDYYRKLNY